MEDLKLVASRVGEALSKAGAEKAQYTATQKETHEFNVDGGEFSLFRTLFDNSLSITAFCGGKKGSIAINKFDEGAVAEAAANCIKSAEAGLADPAYDIAPKQENAVFRDGAYEPDIDKFFDRTRELMSQIKERHPKVLMEQMVVQHMKYHSLYRNTNGTEFESFRGMYYISLMFSAHDGDKTTSFFSSGIQTTSLDRPFIELGCLEKDLADAEASLSTVSVDGKFEGVVVLTPNSLADFLYSALGNFTSNNAILEKTSIWLDKLGKQVADPRITISIKPSDERIVCGERYTGDGFLSEDYDVIRDGVLQSFMLNLYTANKTGYERAKNSSYSLVIEGGDTPYEELIRGIKKGIVVGRFSGGQPGSNGDFSGVAKNSFLIEDGRIAGAVNETMINGNLADMLNQLIAISGETVADGSSVLPYMAFDKIVISGKQAEQ
ncbi:MAG: TldD/PmbA family protein [Lachnospiraceae bacterium]|nr:TldD/PmbA family protein [Lachnospiraceae bacterium]